MFAFYEAFRAGGDLSLDVPRSREDAESVPMVETVGAAESGYDRVEAQFAAEGAPRRPVGIRPDGRHPRVGPLRRGRPPAGNPGGRRPP
jgi:hypothetical protein